MKKLFSFLVLVLIYVPICAQQNTFVRVFNLQGTKMNSGRVFAATDNALQLKGKGGQVISVPVNTIGAIKIGRSAGHNTWIGAASGAVIFGTISALDADEEENSGVGITFSPGAAAVIGGLVGMPIGAALGSISALFKKSRIFIVDGSLEEWKEFQSFMEGKRDVLKTSE